MKKIIFIIPVIASMLFAAPALAATNTVTITPDSGFNTGFSGYVIEYQNDNGVNSGMHGLIFDNSGNVFLPADGNTFCVMSGPSTPCSKTLSDWGISAMDAGTYTIAVVRYGGGSDQSTTVNNNCSTTTSCSNFFSGNYYTDTLTLTENDPCIGVTKFTSTTIGCSANLVNAGFMDYFDVLLQKYWPFLVGVAMLVLVWVFARRAIRSYA